MDVDTAEESLEECKKSLKYLFVFTRYLCIGSVFMLIEILLNIIKYGIGLAIFTSVF